MDPLALNDGGMTLPGAAEMVKGPKHPTTTGCVTAARPAHNSYLQKRLCVAVSFICIPIVHFNRLPTPHLDDYLDGSRRFWWTPSPSPCEKDHHTDSAPATGHHPPRQRHAGGQAATRGDEAISLMGQPGGETEPSPTDADQRNTDDKDIHGGGPYAGVSHMQAACVIRWARPKSGNRSTTVGLEVIASETMKPTRRGPDRLQGGQSVALTACPVRPDLPEKIVPVLTPQALVGAAGVQWYS